MFGNPRRNSNGEFHDLDLLEFGLTPPSPNELLTRAPLISPMQSPPIPDVATNFRLGGGPLGPSLVRSLAAGHPVYYYPESEDDIDLLLGELSDIEL